MQRAELILSHTVIKCCLMVSKERALLSPRKGANVTAVQSECRNKKTH